MIYLKEPTLDDYGYEEKVLKDPKTMNYNAGWDVFYNDYDYYSGCIFFPKEKWYKSYQKRKENNRYFAYIVKKEDESFVGYVNFQYDFITNKYSCGVVIEYEHRKKGYGKEALKLLCEVAFNEYNVDKLYNEFENDKKTLKIFYDVGFEKKKEVIGKRFNKDIKLIQISITKEKYEKFLNKEGN